jgi:Ca2+-binding EF-hand superfamily protein
VTIEDIHNDEQGEPEGATRNSDLSAHLPFDANSDGSITREEYRAYLDAELLAEMDSDGDGQISFAEYRTYEEF